MSQHDTGIDPAPIGYYDEALNTDGIQATWHRLKFARIRELMGQFDRHLDIACGPGTLLGTLSGSYARGSSVGIDLESRQLEFAQKRYGRAPNIDGFVAASAEALPFGSSSFDLVTCVELIEHIPSDTARQLLAEIKRVMAPGGRLILTTPNYRSPWRLLEPIVSKIGAVDYRQEHITHYTRGRLSQLLADTSPDQADVCSFQLAAPFLAPLGQAAVRLQAHLEEQMLRRGGCLLLAQARWS